MPYRDYRVEDFVADLNFQAWVQRPDAVSDAYWQQWMAENPDRIPLITEAREIILKLRTETYSLDEDKIQGQLNRLDARIDAWESEKRAAPVRRLTSRVQWWAAAAVLLLLIMAGGFWLITRTNEVTLATAYGETRTFWLPDSSQVVLNSNSRIRYDRHWAAGRTREVWLEGEAYFTVRPQPLPGGGVKFTVHANELDVNVLGTRFNVYNRGEQTRVVLTSGKIALRIAEPKRPESASSGRPAGKAATATELTMQPGDYVEYSGTQRALVRKTVNPEEHSSWRKGMLQFNFTPLGEVARIIEETYGYRVIIADSLAQGRKISGTLPANNIDILLKALQEGFELESRKEGNTIVLQ